MKDKMPVHRHHEATGVAGIYVHVPFCIRKCPYCDFYSITDRAITPVYVEAVRHEMTMTALPAFLFDTIYFGGGTPSLLNVSSIEAIIGTAHQQFHIIPQSEITLEVNPGTVSKRQFEAYQSIGINRISIGMQSFIDNHLKFLGRVHSSSDARLAVAQAREAGFDNMGIDLIYGIPGQTQSSWLSDLKQAVVFEPEHLSCYMLTYESGTPMNADRQSGVFKPLSDEKVKDLFETTLEFLNGKGYVQYEVSNFEKVNPDTQGSAPNERYRSKHNQKYWFCDPYFGFGPSAHSYMEPVRYWNVGNVYEYIDLIKAGKRPVREKENLTTEQLMIEAVYLGLRTTDGINIKRFDRKFHACFHHLFGKALSDLHDKGLLTASQDRCGLTQKGMLFLDAVTNMLVDCLN